MGCYLLYICWLILTNDDRFFMLCFGYKETLLSVLVVKVQVGGSNVMAGMRCNNAQLTKKGLIRLTEEELSLSLVQWTFLCKLLCVLLLIVTNNIHQSEVLLGHRTRRVFPVLLVERALN